MEMTNKEIYECLEVLERGFVPSSPDHLKALLYLFYCDCTIFQGQDHDFTDKLLRLVEQCNISEANEPTMCGPQGCDCGPRPNEPQPPMPETLQTFGRAVNFMQLGVRRLFFDQKPDSNMNITYYR